ncbi:alpha/beta fold hydrolase [Streptomyces zingiberis]|uniref:Alpha/beta hydrolase n=1 Tax=Streptomyces zingiberis TaxID=2053010 RepID=A0ABX1BWN0_9ACTN|nr:alpha/beta hydrolase [Streptomyces zingiberis]NJQ00142.1 alpha/beta hydrolase [Streptomyces zingiberis]
MEQIRIPTSQGVFDALTAGPAGGRPVLLLHGFPQTGAMWRRQVEALAARGFRAVAPDQRGYSPGVRPEDPAAYGAEFLVGDVFAIADALEWPVFDLVGHDWGGAVAWWAAGARPGRLRTLTVVSTPHPGAFTHALRTDEEQKKRSRYMLDWQETPATEERMLADGARLLRSLFGGSVPPERVEEYVRHLSEPGALTAALNWYRSGSGVPTMGAVGLPTLYVWGTEDIAFARSTAEDTAGRVTGPYRFEALAGVSHWVPEEVPEETNRLLLDHLAAHPAD